MNIIPFEQALPAAASELSRRNLAINSDVASTSNYGTISIKGKVFTIAKDNVRTVITKMDEGEEVPVASLSLTVLRANLKARVYYENAYDEESSQHERPTCFSHDGVTPAPESTKPQCSKCAICPQAVWGSKVVAGKGEDDVSKGTACAPNARLAVAAPNKPDEPMLLRVPPASIKPYREAVKMGEARNLPYNQLVMRIGFDMTAASPKLTFKPVGVLSDDNYEPVTKMYDNDTVMQIVGIVGSAPEPSEAQEASELDAAIAAKAAVVKASKPKQLAAPSISMDEIASAVDVAGEIAPAKPEPKPEPKKKVEAKPEPKAAVKPAPKQAAAEDDNDLSGLLGDLDALLGGTDD